MRTENPVSCLTRFAVAAIVLAAFACPGLCGGNAAFESEDARTLAELLRTRLAQAPYSQQVILADKFPSVVVGDAAGYRIILHSSLFTIKAASQTGPPLPGTEREEHRYLEFVVFPENAHLRPDTASGIKWSSFDDCDTEWTRPTRLGSGHGFLWFANGPVLRQYRIREGLGLNGGEDWTALFAEALIMPLSSTSTGAISTILVAREGEKALDYFEAAENERLKKGLPAGSTCTAANSIPGPRADRLLVILYMSDNYQLSLSAGYALVFTPREGAKDAYKEMLKRRNSNLTARACEVCRQFGWADSLPLIKDIFDNPVSWGEYESAFLALRALSDNPVPKPLLDARDTLIMSVQGPPPFAPTPERPVSPADVEAAKRVLARAEDTEAAAILALSTAFCRGKQFASLMEKHQALAKDVLSALPSEPRTTLLRTLQPKLPNQDDSYVLNALAPPAQPAK